MLTEERVRFLRRLCEDGYSQDMGIYPYPGTDWYRRGDTAIRAVNPVEPTDRLRPGEVDRVVSGVNQGVGNAEELLQGLRVQDEKKVLSAAADLARSLAEVMEGLRIKPLQASFDFVSDTLKNHPILRNPIEI